MSIERFRRAKAIAEQRRWIDQCGGNLWGYVQKYGSSRDAEHYGNGGEAIYTADMEYLERLINEEA